MKKLQLFSVTAILICMMSLSSCQVIGGIFKAGVWVGVLLIVGVLAVVGFVVAKVTNK